MLRRLMWTEHDYAALLLRLAVAVVILPHGAQKLFGWYGGLGLQGTMEYFATLGIPALLGVLAILAESLGALALLVGLFGRVNAFGIGGVMLVAALRVHLPNGFFMNWFGNQPGEGVEYFVLATAMTAILVVRGSGACSLDRLLTAPRWSRVAATSIA